ncbi:hypothetical protein HK101_001872, partial [Irineochytrium annulatum]
MPAAVTDSYDYDRDRRDGDRRYNDRGDRGDRDRGGRGPMSPPTPDRYNTVERKDYFDRTPDRRPSQDRDRQPLPSPSLSTTSSTSSRARVIGRNPDGFFQPPSSQAPLSPPLRREARDGRPSRDVARAPTGGPPGRAVRDENGFFVAPPSPSTSGPGLPRRLGSSDDRGRGDAYGRRPSDENSLSRYGGAGARSQSNESLTRFGGGGTRTRSPGVSPSAAGYPDLDMRPPPQPPAGPPPQHLRGRGEYGRERDEGRSGSSMLRSAPVDSGMADLGSRTYRDRDGRDQDRERDREREKPRGDRREKGDANNRDRYKESERDRERERERDRDRERGDDRPSMSRSRTVDVSNERPRDDISSSRSRTVGASFDRPRDAPSSSSSSSRDARRTDRDRSDRDRSDRDRDRNHTDAGAALREALEAVRARDRDRDRDRRERGDAAPGDNARSARVERARRAEKEAAKGREMERKGRERREVEVADAVARLDEVEKRQRAGEFYVPDNAWSPIDESIVVPDYINGLVRFLHSDKTLTPQPDDFISSDGFRMYQKRIGGPLQQVVSDLLRDHHIDAPMRKARDAAASQPPPQPKQKDATVTLLITALEARNLVPPTRGGRDVYCVIEHIPNDAPGAKTRGQPQTTTTTTPVSTNTLSPAWPPSQSRASIAVRDIADRVVVSVWDRRSGRGGDEFLGQRALALVDVISTCARGGGGVRGWYDLRPRDGRAGAGDRGVGGEVYIEMAYDDGVGPGSGGGKDSRGRSEEGTGAFLERQLVACRVNFKALYRTLLRACLEMDMSVKGTITERDADLLSDESKVCLKGWARRWFVGEACQFICLLELLVERYKEYRIPHGALFGAYEAMYDRIKATPEWLGRYDKPALIELSEQMVSYSRAQVVKYKEFYPKNKPPAALESTVLMWRMVSKSEIYKKVHPELPASFKEQIKGILSKAAEERYIKLYELSAPLDESDLEAVFEGLAKLTDLLTEELEIDDRYFKEAFKRDVDIVGLTADTYTRCFVKTLEDNAKALASGDAISFASKAIFALYRRMKVMDVRYAKLVPSYKKMKTVNVERFFTPFVTNWLDNLSTQTLKWVTNAVKADAFEPRKAEFDDGVPACSSSVTDLFSAVYQELEFITDLGWSNPVQNALFLQKFSRTVYKAVDQYCEAIGAGELKVDQGGMTTWVPLMQSKQANGPKDITNESCVKLCNIEYATAKLEEMYRLMNVAAATRSAKDYRATMAPSRRRPPTSSRATGDLDDDVKGSFRIQVGYAENVKPVTTAGLSNPYVTVRVPEGTVQPPPEADDDGDAPTTPTTLTRSGGSVLTGAQCEMARTRVIYETVNPQWDEEFTLMLPPVRRLDVVLWSKNLLTADEVCGRATIDLGARTRLRRKLEDHHTHDVAVEAEPQGRIMVRLTLEGEEEDVDFWLRRSKERLIRTRDDFLRALCTKISPFAKEVIVKSIREHEAAPLPSKSFFSAITAAVQYSNVTASGRSIHDKVTSNEADVLLAPLTDYLNKNLETLCTAMSARMAREVIKRAWDDVVAAVEACLVPTLHGAVERDRRVLNARQVSMASWALAILGDFFHADGAELGLSRRMLDTRRHADVMALMGVYGSEMRKLRREYEISVVDGREKELVLRLVRLKVEKLEELT